MKSAEEELTRLKVRQATLQKVAGRVDRFAKAVEAMRREVDSELAAFSLDLDALVQVKVDLGPVLELEAETEADIRAVGEKITEGGDGNLWTEKHDLEAQVDEGRKHLRRMIAGVNFNDEKQVVRFIEDVLATLEKAQGGLRSQLKDSRAEAFYDTPLEYIQPRYTLNVGGRGLESLSPGERGMLLLVFYLLVDRGDIPLIIDQPEENLDNQSVFKLLVPCIKEVRKRRQIILVTHNPNLAVVCDAEQVVHAFIDKERKNRVVYTAGAIENPVINGKIVDVLEGTWPAFKNRSTKYELFPVRETELRVLANLHVTATPNLQVREQAVEKPLTLAA